MKMISNTSTISTSGVMLMLENPESMSDVVAAMTNLYS
jgi:phage terminase large subunit-like protein